ncbi:uncharacterized protein DDB_G0271670 isoform X2 [Halyomorpha halys]|nr:uncharacterized protein LOC106692218 isoform X2 [Halyomorpha halys]
MSVFIKESNQILSKFRDNLRKSKETLDRLAIDSEKEELLRNSEARQVEEIENQLKADLLSYGDEEKLFRNGNAYEPLRPNSLAVSLKGNKLALQDILTLLLPSNLRSSEGINDGLSDPQSNFFGIGSGLTGSSTPAPPPVTAIEQFRTIMRAPPPLPKHLGISRVQSNGSILCFSILHVCPTVHMHLGTEVPTGSTTSKPPEKEEANYSIVEPFHPSSPVPYEVYLNNQDIGLDESTSSEYVGDSKQSFSPKNIDSGNSLKTDENTDSPIVSSRDGLIDSYSKEPLDDLINTFGKGINKSCHNSTLDKILFGDNESSTISTSISTSMSTAQREGRYNNSTFFMIFFGGPEISTISTSISTTLSTTQSDETNKFSTLQMLGVTSDSTMQSTSSSTSSATTQSTNNETTGSVTQSSNNATRGETTQSSNTGTTVPKTQSSLSTSTSFSTMKSDQSGENVTTQSSSNTMTDQTTGESTTVCTDITPYVISITCKESDYTTTICTETTETCTDVSCSSEGSSVTNGSTGTTITTEGKSGVSKSSINSTPSKSSSKTTITGMASSTASTTPMPSSTKKSNFFLKLLYYQPNTHRKYTSTTPMSISVSGYTVPFQLVLLEPQILRLPKLNGTIIGMTGKH